MNGPDLNFLLDDFARRVPQVAHAVAVAADGLLVARSERLPHDNAEQAAAAVSGLVSLLRGLGARVFDAGDLESNLCEFADGFLFVMSVADGASVAALASRQCDIGLVTTELAELINRVGPALTPAARASLQAVTGR
jgi:uncharacterized protein